MTTQYLFDAIVLSEHPFREYDRIVSVYTKEMGKLDIHTVGTRKILSKLGPHLLPLRHSRICAVRARFLPKAIAAVSQYNFLATMRDDDAMICAGAVLRLVNDFTKEGQADEELFFLLLETLYGINQLAKDEKKDHTSSYHDILRVFFTSFVSLLGYTPKTEQCFVCRKVITSETRIFIENPLCICTHCSLGSGIDAHTLIPHKDFYTILNATEV